MGYELTDIIEDIRDFTGARPGTPLDSLRSGIPVSAGERLEKVGNLWIYSFNGDDQALPDYDDVDVRVKYKGVFTEGRLVARHRQKILVGLVRDIGIATQDAVVFWDSGSFHSKIRETFEQQAALTQSGKHHLGPVIFGVEPVPFVAWHSPADITSGLSSDERKVLRSLQKKAITLVDSRSGARRRRILAKVAQRVVGLDKRVLVTGPRNFDIDALLARISDGCDDTATMPSIVRLGGASSNSRSKRPLRKYDLDSVAARRDEETLTRIASLRTATQNKRASLRKIERVLNLFSELRETTAFFRKLGEELKPHECRLQDFQRELSKANKVVEETSAALERAKKVSIISRIAEGLKPAHLVQRLRSVDNFRRRVRGQIELLERSVLQKRAECDEARHTVEDLEKLVEGIAEDELQSMYDGLNRELESDLGEIELLEERHLELRQTLLSGADYIAGTFDQVADLMKEVGYFDVVIVEGAGQNMFDSLFAFAGLSTDRLVISGRLAAQKNSSSQEPETESRIWMEGTLFDVYKRIRRNFLTFVLPKVVDLRTTPVKKDRQAVA